MLKTADAEIKRIEKDYTYKPAPPFTQQNTEIFQAMFDAATHIETEAENLLKTRVEEIEPLMAQMRGPLTESDGEWMRERGLELCLIIRALLLERGIK